MKTVRKTIVMPNELARELEHEAQDRGTSFSALVVERVRRARKPRLDWLGSIDIDPEVSLDIQGAIRSKVRETP